MQEVFLRALRQASGLCDIEGMAQRDYARRLGITLPAAKLRAPRARVRLKAQLTTACGVTLDAAGGVSRFVPHPLR